MSKVVETRGNFELVELDESWAPWTAQINRYVDDGAAFGSPGQRICTSMANFETMAAATAAFKGAQNDQN